MEWVWRASHTFLTTEDAADLLGPSGRQRRARVNAVGSFPDVGTFNKCVLSSRFGWFWLRVSVVGTRAQLGWKRGLGLRAAKGSCSGSPGGLP